MNICCAIWSRTRTGRRPTASAWRACWRRTTAPASKRCSTLFFASIPYQWYTNNHIADYEGFYASVFYSYFAALGYDIAVEESSSHGRLDWATAHDDDWATLAVDGHVKVAVRTAGHAQESVGLRQTPG